MSKIGPKAAAGLAALTLALSAGCGLQSDNVGPRTTVRGSSGETITLIDYDEGVTYGKTAVKPLVKMDDVRGADWLNEETLIVSREAASGVAEWVENGKQHAAVEEAVPYRMAFELPRKLYARENATGETYVLVPGKDNQGLAIANPSRTRVFYTKSGVDNVAGTGFVLDLRTRKSVKVTANDELGVSSAAWADDDTLAYAAIDGSIRVVTADGSTIAVSRPASRSLISDLRAAAGNVYYTDSRGSLHIRSLKTGLETIVDGHTVWAVPSPDGSKLGLVQRGRDGHMALSIAEGDGSSPRKVAEDAQIFGLSWSPDGSRLAYALIGQNGTVNAITTTDVLSFISVNMPVNIAYIAETPRWSPSGSRLMVTALQPGDKGGRDRYVTYLVAAE